MSLSQAYALVRTRDLVGIQIGGRNQWPVERIKLEEYSAAAEGVGSGDTFGATTQRGARPRVSETDVNPFPAGLPY